MTTRPAVRASVRAAVRSAVRSYAPPGPYVPTNAETTTYAATITPAASDSLKRTLDNAITTWKGSGAWAKISAAYLFGLSLSNIKNPGTFDATSTGTKVDGSHIATDGATTFVTLPDPTTLTGYGQNSAHFIVRQLNTGQVTVRGNGWFDGTDGIGITSRTNTDSLAFRINQASGSSLSTAAEGAAPVPSGDSLVHVNRSGATTSQIYVDGVAGVLTNAAIASTALNANVLYLGRGAAAEFYAGQYFSASLGASMTAAEAAGFAVGERAIYMALKGLAYPSGRYAPTSLQQVPDGLGGDTGKGFTCTGLVRAIDGSGFWIGNHGRNVQASVAAFAPSLVKVSLTGATKLAEINPLPIYPTCGSIQGVDQLDNGDLIFADQTNGFVRFMTTAGALVSGSFSSAGVNGLALDKPNNKLYQCSTTAIWYTNMDGTGSQNVITGQTNLDMLHYVPSRKWLFVSQPDNGQLGIVRVYDVTTPTSPVLVRNFVCNTALSIEGIWFDQSTGLLYVMHDGYYHASGNQLNQMQTYSLG